MHAQRMPPHITTPFDDSAAMRLRRMGLLTPDGTPDERIIRPLAYGWLDTASGSINYGTNGMPDIGADQMYANAQKAGMAGTMDTMPELVGIALWKQGHIGIYVGNGYAVEAMGTKYGVVRTEVAGRGWQGWCRIPYIEYREAG